MPKPIIANEARPMKVQVMPGSAADLYYRPWHSAQREVIATGFTPSPQSDLIFRGGKTVAQMQYKNFYLGGLSSWRETDMTSIEQAILAAMKHKQLNNVMAQYFRGRAITCDVLPSQILGTRKPPVVSEGDMVQFIKSLFAQGTIANADLGSTIFNFLLPSRTVLSANTAPTGSLADVPPNNLVIQEENSSLQGLGGFHGSVHVNATTTIYYSVDAFSEFLPTGRANGIPVFDQPWKNVVATLYHELNEFRTDPDVDDVIRTGNRAFAGWTSINGEEVGDAPVAQADPLTQVFQEVRLTTRSRVTVPVQFQYSNAVHGPEGPISRPH